MEGPAEGTRTRRRSNDCRNCQRKGIRCSQNHPACNECLRKGLHCRFLLSRGGPSAWRAVNVSSNASAGPRAQEGTPSSTPATSLVRDEPTLPAPQNEVVPVGATPVPATLNISAFKDSVQASWLFNHYAHRPTLQNIIVSSSNQSFGAAAVSAATAIGATLFSRFHNLPLRPHTRPVQAPYCREYAAAVEALSTQIPLFKVDTLEEVMVPALLLLIAESWLTGVSQEHYGGLEQLVRISGDALTQQSRLDLFHEVRLTMVWHAMYRGDRTIFGEERWKSAPFVLVPTPKTPSDHLVDCMADIAALLEDAKKLELLNGEPLPVELKYRARAILHRLFSWRWSWHARNPDGVFDVHVSSGEPFETVLQYAQPHLMYEIWLCDALLILVLAFLNPLDLQVTVPTTTRPTGKLWKPNETPSLQQLAIEIFRSLEYQLENLSAPAPVHQWAMPLALAYVTLSPNDPIATWVMAKIQAAPESRSMPWLTFINRLEGKDRDVAGNVFACWPIKRWSA